MDAFQSIQLFQQQAPNVSASITSFFFPCADPVISNQPYNDREWDDLDHRNPHVVHFVTKKVALDASVQPNLESQVYLWTPVKFLLAYPLH